MVQVKEFKKKNGNIDIDLNIWLMSNENIKIIDIKYQYCVSTNAIHYVKALVIYEILK